MATADLELRPHPKDAVTAAVKTLRTHARACGTGKTLIAASTAFRLAARGRVLVLVPTLDLLSQRCVPGTRPAAKAGRSRSVRPARPSSIPRPATSR
ncbi:DEAD/DEAH box helicase family protein [Streptomyces sp. NPDC060064]|uniref:DEAD/DEAH box helicase family protein n=1 Tax=Streptomyces sp. NPDC060064 TaxID=3347049 RepID=UPI0036879FF0